MKRIRFGRVVLWLTLTALSLLWVAPIFWIVFTSFKTESEVVTSSNVFPMVWTLSSYQDVLSSSTYASQMPVFRWLTNSLFIAATHTLLLLIVSSLSAYAYSRLNFKGKDILFVLQLSTLMIPAVIKIVALYRLMVVFSWVDTPWAMIVPDLGGVGVLFLLRQFMLGIPKELDEAATLDGAGKLRIFFNIILPQCKPPMIVSALFVFLANWNDFMWPVIVTNSIAQRTLPAGLKVLQSSMYNQYAKLAVVAIISALPIFLLYLVAQRYFMKGIALSSRE
jgi:multiple sugar transport system permease protein